MKIRPLLLAGASLLLFATASHAEIKIVTGHNAGDAGFKFDAVPVPAANDAATAAQFALVDGVRDPNGGDLAVLHDSRVPSEE